MKKILLACGVCATLMATAACGGSSAASTDGADSLSVAMGEFNGSQLCMQYSQLPEDMKAKFNKQEMLKGIKEVLLTDTARQSYMTGMQIGMQLWGQIYQMQSMGVKVDTKALLAAYEKAFLADSVGDMSAIANRHQQLMMKAQQQMMAEQEARAKAEQEARANSPEAKKNAADGAAYIEKAMKEDPSIVKEDNGLAYKKISDGNGPTATESSRVKVKYTGKLIDGKVFDSNDSATFPVKGVIPGFGQGLMKMNKGAHYILYIPGDLAYGVDGTPNGDIGPNATLIFDVEVLDIEN